LLRGYVKALGGPDPALGLMFDVPAFEDYATRAI